MDEALHRNAELGVQVQRFEQDLKLAQLTIEKLKVEIAYLRRMKYGSSSERLEHAQLDLRGGEMAPAVTPEPPGTNNVSSLDEQRRKRARRTPPSGRGLPEHLPRRTVVHLPAGHQANCGCPACAWRCARLARTSAKCWTTSPAASMSCATCARSWPAGAARTSSRPQHLADPSIA
ncbi:transposase [Roseateles sp.]|uniref:transposase n=1 Tax=Roseateles sp. TaxID=1971397 RepID=UPI0025E53059|nr:transposase [Roseateles sp.]